MPFFERQFFTQMTAAERREEKFGKPLLTGSALGGDKFRNISFHFKVKINEAEFIVKGKEILSVQKPEYSSKLYLAEIC